ncbi:MAG: hypothetical protein KBA81_01610 [Rhabdochlamydiaceae bacterium]|nr:hypothetical protein [Rhabdochlamydiaceae bacterium]
MSSVLLRFFGPGQAMSAENVLQKTQIKVAAWVQNPPEIQSLEDLKSLVGNNDIDYENGITLIHRTIEVNHEYIDKAEIAWKSTEKKLGRATLASFFVSLITFGAAGYFSIKEGKNLKAAAVCVFGVAAAIFARIANRASKLAQSQAIKVGQIINDMNETRTLIAENGIMSFDASVFVPEVPKLFTPQEQDLLLTEWVSKLREAPPTEPEQLVQLGKKLSALRDFRGETFEALMRQYFEVIDNAPNQIPESFEKIHQYFDGLFKKFRDHDNQGFLVALQTRFQQENTPPVVTQELHYEGMSAVWADQLQIMDDQEQVQFYPGKYAQVFMLPHFKNIFSRVFAAEEAPQRYVEWLRQQIQNLPEGTKHKKFLLACLSKEVN